MPVSERTKQEIRRIIDENDESIQRIREQVQKDYPEASEEEINDVILDTFCTTLEEIAKEIERNPNCPFELSDKVSFEKAN